MASSATSIARLTWREIVVAMALFASMSAAANAHSWYPPVCCNDIDCMVVTSLKRTGDGRLLLEAGHISVIVPAGFPVQTSEDRDAHVCVYRDVRGKYHPRCVFLPAET